MGFARELCIATAIHVPSGFTTATPAAPLWFQCAASLLLEAADLLLPLLRTLWRQATSAASWLLVRLVGQAVALVRRGVQQGSAQAAAAAQGKQPAGEKQRRRRRRRQQQAGQEEGDGTQPGWAWQG